MSDVQYLTFKVDGEWLTGFARTRFWEEKCGYENAIKLLKDSLGDDFPEEICIEMLEGRKKLVGINEFDLVDDNEKIRPLTLYLREQELNNRINKIQRHIETYPYNYVDQYACSTSRKYWIEQRRGLNWSISDWYNALFYERGVKYDILKNGCNWLENDRETAKIIAKKTDKTELNYKEFAELVYKEYEELINIWKEKKIPFIDLTDYQQSIICRNQHYALLNKIYNYNYLGETVLNRLKYQENIKKEEEKAKDNKMLEVINTHVTKELKLIEDPNIKSKKSIVSSMFPEFEGVFDNSDFDTAPININNIKSGWDGFIDPQGNFYQTKPIGSTWYNGTANCHMEFAIQYLKEKSIKIDRKDEKDYLIKVMGWCDYAHFILLGSGVHVNKPKKLTREQEKTLFKLFELNEDNLNEYYELTKD